jgi:hypothetical protein
VTLALALALARYSRHNPGVFPAANRSPQAAQAPGLAFAGELVLPQSHDVPSFLPKDSVDELGPPFVRLYFGVPERAVRFRGTVAAWTSVPKAAVNEEGQAPFGKHEVRLANKWVVPPPASYAVGPKHLDQPQLGAKVPLRANPGH